MFAKKIAVSFICILLTMTAYASNQSGNNNSSYNLNNSNWGAASDDDAGPDQTISYDQYRPTPAPKPVYRRTVTKTYYKSNFDVSSYNLFYLGAYGGYGVISGAYKQDGQFTQGRLATGAAYASPKFIAGAELGFQSGNTMHLAIDQDLVLQTGGLQWLATLKPLVDFLVATKIRVTSNQPLFLSLKAGIAYRQLQLDDRTSSTYYLNKINPEVQAGLNFNLTDNAMLTMFYQGIYSTSNVGASINSYGNGVISFIPTQQAGFLGVEYSL